MRYITPKNILLKRFKNKLPAWDIALLCFRNFKNIDRFINKFKAKPIKRKILWGFYPSKSSFNIFKTKIDNKSIIIVIPCNWGGPQSAILVEELAHLGIQYIIGYGLAGSLDRNILRGEQIVVTSALTTDGTSKFYTNKKTVKPDNYLLKLARSSKKVKCATIDAIYQETKKLINKWKNMGVQVINMESSPFYAASEKCKVKSIWLGYITDCLFSNWKAWHGHIKGANEESINKCLNIISSIKI